MVDLYIARLPTQLLRLLTLALSRPSLSWRLQTQECTFPYLTHLAARRQNQQPEPCEAWQRCSRSSPEEKDSQQLLLPLALEKGICCESLRKSMAISFCSRCTTGLLQAGSGLKVLMVVHYTSSGRGRDYTPRASGTVK